MTSQRTGEHHDGIILVADAFGFDWSARHGIESGRPVHVDVIVAGDEFAIGSVDHVKETILGRLHQHLPQAAVDLDISEHDVLGGSVVPGLARRGLEVPDIFAGVGTQRDDR